MLILNVLISCTYTYCSWYDKSGIWNVSSKQLQFQQNI